ncbi:MAG: hypothetical protein V7672_04655 [Brevundimonas sp.]|uniref:hypothetical protein n=1 Tax=Brevundimonas sp. TaxID=1871086 RepID=UPI0030039C0C
MGATIVLQNHGAVVYIDEIDPEMPPYAGDGGGCVLGLDARHLEHDAGVAIRTVVYDEALVDRMLCLGLGVVQQQLEDDPDDHPTLSDYARRLCVDLFSMKHPPDMPGPRVRTRVLDLEHTAPPKDRNWPIEPLCPACQGPVT